MTYPLSMLVPWKYSMGVELTFIARSKKKLDSCEFDRRLDVAQEKMEVILRGHKKRWFHNISQDPGCIEVPTIPLKSWEEAHEAWHVIVGAAKKSKAVPWLEFEGTGQGHIHTGLKPWQQNIILSDIIARPYLGWCFGDPNGSQYYMSMENYRPAQILEVPRDQMKEYKQNRAEWYMNSNKSYLVRHCKKEATEHELRLAHTMEWRGMEAAADWDIMEENIAFLQAYYQRLLKGPWPAWGGSLYDDPNDGGFFSSPKARYVRSKETNIMLAAHKDKCKANIDYCIQEFKALINALELPWKRYKWRVDAFLEPAFRFGDRY